MNYNKSCNQAQRSGIDARSSNVLIPRVGCRRRGLRCRMGSWRLLVAVISMAMAAVSILRGLISIVPLTLSVSSDILGL